MPSNAIFSIHKLSGNRFSPRLLYHKRQRHLNDRSRCLLISTRFFGDKRSQSRVVFRNGCLDFYRHRYDKIQSGKRFLSESSRKASQSKTSVLVDGALSLTTTPVPIEQVYTKLTNHEHILLRPGMYIGSTDDVTVSDYWTYDIEAKRMKKQELKFSPALLKVFDEILVNACDQKVRGAGTDRINVTINGNKICIENNGTGIPIEVYKETGEYLPQMLFGSLYTGSNFLDNKKQVVGGENKMDHVF